MMDRAVLKAAWERYYQDHGTASLAGRTRALEVRMRALGRLRQAEYHGYNTRTLQVALGMSYGVHKQLMGGLHPHPLGVTLEGGRGGIDLKSRLARG